MSFIKRYVLIPVDELHTEGISVDWVRSSLEGKCDPWEAVCCWQNVVDGGLAQAIPDSAQRIAWAFRCGLIHINNAKIDGVERRAH